jgi:hypothetical protein
VFIIEDELHAEHQGGEFLTFADAIAELERRAAIPWDETPNLAPCKRWRTCGRRYEIIEFDMTVEPWRELRRFPALSIRAKGIEWLC